MSNNGARLAPVNRMNEYKLKALPLSLSEEFPMNVMIVGNSKEIAHTNAIEDKR